MNAQPSSFNVAILDDCRFFLKLMVQTLHREKERNSFTFWSEIDVRVYSSLVDFELNDFTQPDVAIIDYYLGQTNGLQLIKSLQLKNKDCRVLLISGEASVPQKVSYTDHGAPTFLSKLDPHFFDKLRVFVEESYLATRS
ncbi:MAG: hypothetical protein CSA03_02265 [Bacteroidetes bacterium]|nr:MAG: hypothetical protein CSA03_02265 [Bacteroidota bacterium]